MDLWFLQLFPFILINTLCISKAPTYFLSPDYRFARPRKDGIPGNYPYANGRKWSPLSFGHAFFEKALPEYCHSWRRRDSYRKELLPRPDGQPKTGYGALNKLPRAKAHGFLARQKAIASAQPATADIAPGGHSSPSLKAVGFSGRSYKI